jgi:hypothetical protein
MIKFELNTEKIFLLNQIEFYRDKNGINTTRCKDRKIIKLNKNNSIILSYNNCNIRFLDKDSYLNKTYLRFVEFLNSDKKYFNLPTFINLNIE